MFKLTKNKPKKDVKPRKTSLFRLYPTHKQERKLEEWLGLSCEVYNAALDERKSAYRMAGVSLSYEHQCAELPGCKEVRPELDSVPSQVLQDVVKRVDLAFAAFFQRVTRLTGAEHTDALHKLLQPKRRMTSDVQQTLSECCFSRFFAGRTAVLNPLDTFSVYSAPVNLMTPKKRSEAPDKLIKPQSGTDQKKNTTGRSTLWPGNLSNPHLRRSRLI